MTQKNPKVANNESLVFSLYGALFEGEKGGLSLGCFYEMLALFDYTKEATRLLLSRMARKGLLEARRKGKASFYFLSASGKEIVSTAERRSVFRGAPSAWDGMLSLVSYELPESLREARLEFARVLAHAGFGRAAVGLWVYAYEIPEPIVDYVRRSPIAPFVERYRAEHQGDAKAFALRIWRLDERRSELDAYVDRYSKAKAAFEKALRSRRPPSDAECFARYFGNLSAFVSAMARLPPVPAELLPDDWPASRASELFAAYRALVREGCQRFFDSVYEPFD